MVAHESFFLMCRLLHVTSLLFSFPSFHTHTTASFFFFPTPFLFAIFASKSKQLRQKMGNRFSSNKKKELPPIKAASVDTSSINSQQKRTATKFLHGRTYHDANSSYWFPNDDKENDRLIAVSGRPYFPHWPFSRACFFFPEKNSLIRLPVFLSFHAF